MGYQEKKQIVLDELEKSLGAVKEEEVEQFVDMICDAQQVFVVGVGRVLLMLQAFAKRLNHLGIKANYVGAIDEPAITEHDVLVVGSGSGESVVPLEIMKIAKKYNAKIVHIGSNEHSSMKEYEDLFVRIPCSTKLGLEDEVKSEFIEPDWSRSRIISIGTGVELLVTVPVAQDSRVTL